MREGNKKETLFVTGIDTDAGKSYATGWLAKKYIDSGEKVITQKMVQTGNTEISEDIEVHRKIMQTGMLPEDRLKLTMPQIFTYPASAHLAARIDGREVDIEAIDRAREELEKRYDRVLVEGAGGLMVPLKEDYLAIDYLSSRKMGAVLVTNGKLGSINHTLLSLEAMKHRGIEVRLMIYNSYYDYDATVCGETRRYLGKVLGEMYPEAGYEIMPGL